MSTNIHYKLMNVYMNLFCTGCSIRDLVHKLPSPSINTGLGSDWLTDWLTVQLSALEPEYYYITPFYHLWSLLVNVDVYLRECVCAFESVCVCVEEWVCTCLRERACVFEIVRVCVCVCERMCVFECACVWECAWVWVCVRLRERVCVCVWEILLVGES